MERERTVTRGSDSLRPGAWSRLHGGVGARVRDPEWRIAVREAWGAAWTSRLVVWGAGLLGILWLGRAAGTQRYDPESLSRPYSWFGDLLVGPAARWDSVWYLRIAEHGYGTAGSAASHPQAAFYPLYPLLMRAGGWVVGSPLLAGILVSLVCFLVALVLLHRLVALELGPREARGTLLLVAFFPTAFFFSAVYSESLFLLLSVGAFLAARQGRWAWAGTLGGLAALTRNSGVVLLVPLVLLFAGQRPGPSRWQALWLALVPAGLALYLGWSALALGDALAPFHAQALWLRHFEPLGALTRGARAAWDGLRQLAHGAPTPRYFAHGGGDPFHTAGDSVMLFGFAIFALVACAGALRRLPLAYGAYAAIALATTLSYPIDAQPLISFPRYIVVLFPLQMWLARWSVERGGMERAVGVSAVLLGLFAAYFAHWGFVA